MKERVQAVITRRVRWAAFLMVLVVLGVSWSSMIDRWSAEYIDGALLQASAAFATARALNALLSVFQSTTLSIPFVGGAHVGIGELLEPLNDLVGQYASLMQLAIGSLVIQKVLLEMVSDTVFKVLLSASALLFWLSLLVRGGRHAAPWCRVFLFMAFLRFVLVAVVLLNAWVDQQFISPQVRSDLAVLEGLPGRIDVLDGVAPSERPVPSGQPMLRDRERALRARQAEQKEVLGELEEALSAAYTALAAQEKNLSLLERLNLFARSEDYQQAKQAAARAHGAWLAQQAEVRDTARQLAMVVREMDAMARAEERQEGFWASLGQGMGRVSDTLAKLGDPDTYAAIKAALESAVDTVLSAMALFILKTLILPLLFLFAAARGFRTLWGADIRSVLSAGYRPRSTGQTSLSSAPGTQQFDGPGAEPVHEALSPPGQQ